MSGEELYTLIYKVGLLKFGYDFTSVTPAWADANQVTHDLYNASAAELGNKAAAGPISLDEWLSSFDWAGQQALYQRLYDTGHRIY
jgi:hypothetical protein